MNETIAAMQAVDFPKIVLLEFFNRFGRKPVLYRSPGRINIVGEHTDYNGGFVFPATVDLYTWAAMAPRDDGIMRVHFCSEDHTDVIEFNRLEQGEKGRPVEYLKAVAWSLREAGIALRGCDVAISGNIPIGGGLSSSASLEVLLACVLLDCAGIELSREKLALLCQRAEAEFVGVQCGIMDQYTVALGSAGNAMMLDCRSLEFNLVPIPEDVRFLVVHSGVKHSLAAGSYNSRREECQQAVSTLSAAIPRLAFLSELSMEQLEAHRELLEERLYRRCRHVVTENQRVLDAREALMKSDLDKLGRLVTNSHQSLRDDYQVSCAELDLLVDIACGCEGVMGSRMMGGGFGGCTISMVDPDVADDVVEQISAAYAGETGRAPWMHMARPADAAGRIEDHGSAQ